MTIVRFKENKDTSFVGLLKGFIKNLEGLTGNLWGRSKVQPSQTRSDLVADTEADAPKEKVKWVTYDKEHGLIETLQDVHSTDYFAERKVKRNKQAPS